MRPSSRLFASISKTTTPLAAHSSFGRLNKKPPPLSLEHFIQRQRVLALYRSILRSLFRIPREKRSEPLAYARGEFERNTHVQDVTQIRYLVSTGKAEFDGMRRYIDELAAQ